MPVQRDFDGDEVASEMLAVLRDCLLLFESGHAIDHFDWGKSFLTAEDIRELNDLPIKIRAVIRKAAPVFPVK